MIDVTVLLIGGGYASTAVAPIEVFSSAGVLWNDLSGGEPKPQFRVTTASVDGKPVRSVHSLSMEPQARINDIEKADLIIVPASYVDFDQRIAEDRLLLPWLRTQYSQGACVAGVCSGVAYLAEAGLLDGKRATTHWGLVETFARRYPKANWHPKAFVTEDERVFCSGGVYAAIDLSLYLVAKFCGHETALLCAKSLLVDMPRTCQAGYAVLPLARPHGDMPIRQAEEWIQQHFQGDVRVEQLAAQAKMSPRTFIRRFKAATGQMPLSYLQALRMAAAKRMLEDGSRSIQEVVSSVGYDDSAFFRELFKRHTGLSPAAYRARFGTTPLGRIQ